jgi:hypothetical protein
MAAFHQIVSNSLQRRSHAGGDGQAPDCEVRVRSGCELRRHRFNFLWRDPAESRILIVLPLWDCGQRDSAVHQIHSLSLDRHGSTEGAFVLGRTLRPNRGRRIGLPPQRDLAPDATQMVAALSK